MRLTSLAPSRRTSSTTRRRPRPCSRRTATAVLAWPIFASSRVRVVTVSEAVAHYIGAPTPGTVKKAHDARGRMVEAGLAAVEALARSTADRLPGPRPAGPDAR